MSSTDSFIRICALILLLISVALAFRQPIDSLYDSHKLETRSAGRHYCGNNLVRALHFLCESYNKRSSFAPLHRHSRSTQDLWNDIEALSSDDSNERPNQSIFSLLNNDKDMNHFHRTVRGVVDECCRRSCSTSQLSQYCGVTRVTTTTAPPPVE